VWGSVEAMRAAGRTLIDPDDASKGAVQLRIGIHSGPCMASVVGRKNPKCVRKG
jgi:class 3 adenylate cyclase